MALPRILRTTSFRFTLIYAALFIASVAALGGILYRSVTSALEQQVAQQVSREMTTLLADYRVNGLDSLSLLITSRQQLRRRGAPEYSLQSLRGRILAGASLPHGPAAGRMQVPDAWGNLANMYVETRQLPNGETLIVANDLDWISDVQAAILQAFGWALLATLGLALGSGLLLSARFLNRLDAMTRTAATIVGGDLTSRIPISGAGDDFDRLGVSFNTMLDRLSQTMDSLRQVSNDIAHDLRTPLTRLKTTLEQAALNAATQADVEQALATANAQADDILATFSALLRIAQIEAGSRRKAFQRLDLGELVTTGGQDFRAVAEDSGRSLDVATTRCDIDGDRELLTQLVINLIENAIRHTPAGSRIAVAVSPSGRTVNLAVSDNGPGVPEAERSKIFNRFYRTETSRSTPGSGLGLALVAAIADMHGATYRAAVARAGLGVEVDFTPAAPTLGNGNLAANSA